MRKIICLITALVALTCSPALGSPSSSPEFAPGARSFAAMMESPDGRALVARQLRVWMRRTVPESPLVAHADAFVREGWRQRVDPRFMVALAMQETRLGTRGHGARIHNPFGWGPFHRYGSWSAGIARVTSGIRRYYLDEGRRTIPAIAAKYAPVGAHNDTRGLNGHWVSGVGAAYRSMGARPRAPVVLG